MKIEIATRQKIKINRKILRHQIQAAGRLLAISSKSVSFLFCDSAFIRELNNKYFGRDRVTDVIAFSLADKQQKDYLGEIVVSVEEAGSVARQRRVPLMDELMVYVIHGMLHLIG